MWRIVLLIFTYIGYLYPGHSQVIVLSPDQKEIILPVTSLEIFEDSLHSFTLNEVKKKQGLFSVNKSFSSSDYNAESIYWVRLQLDLSKSEFPRLIEFYDQTIDHIEVYKPKRSAGYEKVIMGDHYSFFNKPLRHKNFEVIIDENAGQFQVFYFRIISHKNSDIRIAIRTIDRFVHYSLVEYFLYGIFYGMIVIISLYNLLIYAAIREIKNIYYTFYILSVGLYAACVDGIAYQFLWPSFPEWNEIAHGVALFSLICWAVFFAKAFLNTSIRAPRLDRWLNFILILRIALFLYAVFINTNLFQYRNIEIVPLSFIFYISIAVLIKGYKPARFFVAAYGFLFLGFVLKALLAVEILPFSILSYYSLHICFLIEMLLLAYALSDRVRILKNLRDRALRRSISQHEENMKLKDKVNRELERKIKERTIELEEKNNLLIESNKKLSLQAEEISRMNSLLGKDNWRLKKHLKEVLQDRLFNKDLTYDEFHKIFPDEISCHKFLDKMKWARGYRCQKCKNEKYSDGKTKYARRCTKCGYEESVTSHTVFHRLKFPIEKAFYILYLINNNPDAYTLDELSHILELRRNTIWSFKKKSEQIVNDKDYQKMTMNPETFYVK